MSRSDVQLGTGASAETISEAEAEIGPLPVDYREFLTEFGWLTFGHREIYGLGEGVPRHLDVVFITDMERRQGGLPASLVPVMNDGGGNLTCLVVEPDGRDELGSVVLWDHETGPRCGPEGLGRSFRSWLSGLAAG